MKIPFSRPIIVILFFILVIFIFWATIPQKFNLKTPNGGEIIRAGWVFQVQWSARKIGEINLYLVKEGSKEKVLIGEKIPARQKSFSWRVNPWQEPREDYKIYVEEVATGKILDKSEKTFTIWGPKFADCYQFALADPDKVVYLPSDYPGIRRIFITNGTFSGAIGNLQKADEICQREAQSMGLEGKWQALLGDENEPTRKRIAEFEGIIVEAPGGLTVIGEYLPSDVWGRFKQFIQKAKVKPEVKSKALQAHETLSEPFNSFLNKMNSAKAYRRCHRFLAYNFQEFLEKLQKIPVENLQSLWGGDFVGKLKSGVWWGVFDENYQKECIDIPALKYYSLTTTCGNWSLNKNYLEGFVPGKEEQTIPVKYCYDPSGEKILAGAIGGRAILLKDSFFTLYYGAPCSSNLRLICIEQETE
ncbi:hypothetical protein H5T58_00750 [Candidatus Parcubacteria bacterium]|nr:hypothetical protein [Candidatus Parcubacteria bacterium]